MANYTLLIPHILRWEGGYANDPSDKGGETNKGVTIATWKAHGYDCAEKIPVVKVGNKTYTNVTKSLYEITDAQWNLIFKKGYWDIWRADEIRNQAVANVLVDWVYNSGTIGITAPQRILGVTADGRVGDKTMAAVNSIHPLELYVKVQATRHNFVENIVQRDTAQAKFLAGWKNRINSLNYNE